MADIKFGVNLLPLTNLSGTIGSSTQKWSDVYATNFHGKADEADTGFKILVNPSTAPTAVGSIWVQTGADNVASSGAVTISAPTSGTKTYSVTVPNGSATQWITFTFTINSNYTTDVS